VAPCVVNEEETRYEHGKKRGVRMSNDDHALERTAPVWQPSTTSVTVLKRLPWTWIAVVGIVSAGVLTTRHIRSSEAPPSRSPPATVPVAVATAKRRDVPVYLNGIGTVTPYNTVTVKTRVDGQLDRVDFREGQIVREGALLAEIDSRPFQVQLDQAKGQLARDEAQLQNANTLLSRYQVLWSQDSVARQDLDAQAATVGQLQGTITSDKAAIASAQLNLTYSRIIAPITGRAGLRQVDPGNIVHAADTTGIVVLTQVEPIAVLFTLPEDSLQTVLKNMAKGTLTVDAFDRQDQTELAHGKMLTLDNRIDPTTGVFKIKAVFDNKDARLFPDQFVNVRLLAETQPARIVVPSVAVQHGTQGPFVYAVGPDHTARLRSVKTGIGDKDDVVIASGVSAGDTVVVEGADRLRDGMRVDIRPREPRSPASGSSNPATIP
jgi:multidrug efflux system membrane fusion protein